MGCKGHDLLKEVPQVLLCPCIFSEEKGCAPGLLCALNEALEDSADVVHKLVERHDPRLSMEYARFCKEKQLIIYG